MQSIPIYDKTSGESLSKKEQIKLNGFKGCNTSFDTKCWNKFNEHMALYKKLHGKIVGYTTYANIKFNVSSNQLDTIDGVEAEVIERN